jgi:hypothetical protein
MLTFQIRPNTGLIIKGSRDELRDFAAYLIAEADHEHRPPAGFRAVEAWIRLERTDSE